MTTDDLIKLNMRLGDLKEIENVIIIRKGATNGDVIKAMFPNAEYEVREYVVIFTFGGVKRELPIGWWNAPYKEESEEV